ncbi:MAG: molecular chaperone DnaJ [Bacillota bacterium]|nr:molecular chaperone DnaJ [Bacillota bacterium]
MAVERDYYEILGIGRDASDEEIKRAFRQMARQNHPDANPGDPVAEERFKEINEAYEVLRDPDKRAAYDRFGHAGVNGRGVAGGGGPGSPFGGFEDIFDMFFGGAARGGRGARPQSPARGADLELGLEIELREAADGLEREVDIDRIESCQICGGTGSRPGSRPARCPTCQGTGQVTTAQNTLFGRFVTSRACDHCGGQGFVVTDPCDECAGRGMVRRRRRLKVTVPPGVDSGTRLRLGGQGQGGLRGGPPGDLYVHIIVRRHPRFERRGADLESETAVSFVRAALGGRVAVETLYGPAELDLPPGTQPGDVIRMRGHGMPDARRGHARGDLRVTVRVEVPRRLSRRQRELFTELARESGEAGFAGTGDDGEAAAGMMAAASTGKAAAGGPGGASGRGTAAGKPGGPGGGGAAGGKPGKKRGKTLVERMKDAFAGDRDE